MHTTHTTLNPARTVRYEGGVRWSISMSADADEAMIQTAIATAMAAGAVESTHREADREVTVDRRDHDSDTVAARLRSARSAGRPHETHTLVRMTGPGSDIQCACCGGPLDEPCLEEFGF